MQIHPTRSQRLEKLVSRITRSYRRCKLQNRPLDRHIRRATRLTDAYIAALESERSAG